MFYPFFALAAKSPGRQDAFRNALIGHLGVLLVGSWFALQRTGGAMVLGHSLLIAGIVEGAFLIGWRLTQLPKSQALEFLLVSPLRPWNVFLAEALIGLVRLGLVTLTGLPVLVLLCVAGRQEPGRVLPPPLLFADLAPLLLMPFTWGAITGLGLIAWAYEPLRVRRWAERIALGFIIFYLAIGVVVGENLALWLDRMPEDVGVPYLGGADERGNFTTLPLRRLILDGFQAFHLYNPFGVMQYWFQHYGLSAGESAFAWEQFGWLSAGATLVCLLLTARASGRLQGHFHERHYSPAVDESRGRRGQPGDRPLAWWAVRRVTEYSGRINIWLASGFGIVYAVYTVAEPYWPPWLGRGVFLIFERAGGIPGLATALVVLAAVPAAFQYGLWDSNAQDRCRRLELLLLTGLDAYDYWGAAAAAAWRRGRGYFVVALFLWLAAGLAGKIGFVELLASLAASVILWSLYFVLGFRAFARGHQANGLGVLLTVGMPLVTYALFRAHWPGLAAFLPPGSVYGPAAGLPPLYWLPGPLLAGTITLLVARRALARCESELRAWYELHHGRRVMD